MVRTKQKS